MWPKKRVLAGRETLGCGLDSPKTIRDFVTGPKPTNQLEGMASSTSLLPHLLAAPASPHPLQPSTSPCPRHLRSSPATLPLRAARRRHLDAVVVAPDARPWVGDLSGAAPSYRDGGQEDDDDADEEEENDRSLDLLVKFLQSMFKKASRRARRAARSVLPPSVPAELVRPALHMPLRNCQRGGMLGSLSALSLICCVPCVCR